MSGRMSAGRQFVVAAAAATARMLLQHVTTSFLSMFAFLHQELAKSNTRTYQSLAASGSLAGTVTWCTPVTGAVDCSSPRPDIEGHTSGRAAG
jgi:hypothetical protein